MRSALSDRSPGMGSESSSLAGCVDLFLDFDMLTSLLVTQLQAGQWLDSFLLAAGASQVLDDYLHQQGSVLVRGAAYLQRGNSPMARAAGAAAGLTALAATRCWEILPGCAELQGFRRELSRLAEALADAVLQPSAAGEVDGLLASWLTRVRRSDLPVSLRRAVQAMPSCFRSFDQHPQDVQRLVSRFAERYSARTRPLLVVGVRTSGSYLAPLCAAALRQFGYRRVQTLTLRPHGPLLRGERDVLRHSARRGGLVLLLDDPPTTGNTVAEVAARLEQAGFPPDAIVLLLALFGARPELPPVLQRFIQVLLAGPDWHVVDLLRPQQVASTLARLLPPHLRVQRVTAAGDPAVPLSREHVRALFTVRLHDQSAGCSVVRDLVAEGVGLGYLGRHALTVAGGLTGRIPQVYGLDQGLLFSARTDWSAWATDEGTPEAIAAYVATRRRSLAVARDRSLLLAGRQPVWEVAADLLSGALGRLGTPLRVPLIDPLVRGLVAVDKPCIIDGRMDLSRWHPTKEGLVKTDFADGAFSHLDLNSYDPVFDLAGAAVAAEDIGFTRRLREHYAAGTGQAPDEERWLLYQLVHLWDAARTERISSPQARRRSAAAMQHYLAATFLTDVEVNPRGPYCALDIDGVLETAQLGFPASTRAGALALRALIAHGYRPLLATGRCLAEVRDRCEAYQLPGGVAEYGAVIYDHVAKTVVELVPPSSTKALIRLRAELARIPGVHIDADYERIVRAYRGEGGRYRGLDKRTIRAAMASAGVEDAISVVVGMAQTDFVPAGVDKATGLQALCHRRCGDQAVLAMAVGDGIADAGMLGIAQLPFAPGNAAPALRGAARVVRAQYQAGLAAAVGQLLGHPPGGCGVCQMNLIPDAQRLLALLSVLEAGAAGAPRRLVQLMATLRGRRRTGLVAVSPAGQPPIPRRPGPAAKWHR
jgi:hydroxymethylpyrimidine pyrophosphatase-like HAD family hydrolase/adenine/guanine phosphoribosyltransferase-like PRPP-binding protein